MSENQLNTHAESGSGVQTLPPQVDYSPAERAAESEVRALVEARCLMALRRPRNIHQARAKILEACSRPSFAEQALYRKPVGKKGNEQVFAEGPSIRFAEEAFRALGNLWASVTVQLETSEKRVLRMDLMDLEANNTDSTIVTVPKTVERSFIRDGQTVLSQRMNSYGKLVYLIEANDDELQVKQQAMIAKARRDAIVRALPSDIKEDAIRKAKQTLADRDTKDPQGALKALMDAFQSECRVMPDQIEKFLGHTLAVISPAEIMGLRGIYTAVKEGEVSWHDVLKNAEEDLGATLKAAAVQVEARKAAKQNGPGAQQSGEGHAEGNQADQKPLSAADKAKAQATKTGAAIQGGSTLDIPI